VEGDIARQRLKPRVTGKNAGEDDANKKGAKAHLPSLGTILDPKLTSPCGARDDLKPLAK
jgi:hypothetical protein